MCAERAIAGDAVEIIGEDREKDGGMGGGGGEREGGKDGWLQIEEGVWRESGGVNEENECSRCHLE